MKDLFMQILTALVQMGVLAGLGFSIAFLKTKLGETNFNKYSNIVGLVVKSIEQSMGEGNGQQKKEAVIQYMEKYVGKYLSHDDLEKLIEAAVYEMNQVKNQNINSTTTITPVITGDNNQTVVTPTQTTTQEGV